MKILHIGLTCHFTDNMLYQENILSDYNVKAGHDVTFISDTYEYRDGVLVETDECDIILPNGVRLIRIKYDYIINAFVSTHIQKAKKLVQYLNEIEPDAILYHGVCGYELMNVAEYVRNHNIPFYIDSHENFKNTAMTPISKFAYKYIHGAFVKKALPAAKKVLYVGYPEKDYLVDMYHISESMLEYFPLGGIILDENNQSQYRHEFIDELNLPNDAIICAHSGKMDRGKKTEEVLRAFARVNDNRLRLLIFGSIPDDVRLVIEPLIQKDDRVFFLGWKNPEEQRRILGATDLYLQPGTYSATAQIALCDGCALLLNNGYYRMMGDAPFYEEDEQGIEDVLRQVTSNEQVLIDAKKRCFELAKRTYDYSKMADRYLK